MMIYDFYFLLIRVDDDDAYNCKWGPIHYFSQEDSSLARILLLLLLLRPSIEKIPAKPLNSL